MTTVHVSQPQSIQQEKKESVKFCNSLLKTIQALRPGKLLVMGDFNAIVRNPSARATELFRGSEENEIGEMKEFRA